MAFFQKKPIKQLCLGVTYSFPLKCKIKLLKGCLFLLFANQRPFPFQPASIWNPLLQLLFLSSSRKKKLKPPLNPPSPSAKSESPPPSSVGGAHAPPFPFRPTLHCHLALTTTSSSTSPASTTSIAPSMTFAPSDRSFGTSASQSTSATCQSMTDSTTSSMRSSVVGAACAA